MQVKHRRKQINENASGSSSLPLRLRIPPAGRIIRPNPAAVFFELGYLGVSKIMVGRKFPSMGTWLRVSVGKPEEMRAFLASLRQIIPAVYY